MATIQYTTNALSYIGESLKRAPLPLKVYKTIKELGISRVEPTIHGCRGAKNEKTHQQQNNNQIINLPM